MRDYSVSRRHPDLLRSHQPHGTPEPGGTVAIRAATVPRWVGRLVAGIPDTRVSGASIPPKPSMTPLSGVWRRRLRPQRPAGFDTTNAFRLVNAEADGRRRDRRPLRLASRLPVHHHGRRALEPIIVESLTRLWPCAIYERSDADVRKHEGLEPVRGCLAGAEPPERIEIRENGCRFLVDIRGGHKTGFYLDQRDNRALVTPYTTSADVLDVFSYTGAFGIMARQAGAASVTHIDLSSDALALARENTRLNVCDGDADENFIAGNTFEVLRTFRDSRRSFDVIVLDPPKFGDARKHVMAACRGYKDINLLALKLLRPGGILATFSCSGLVTPDLFHKVVADAAVDARRDVQVIRRLQQASDHPEGLGFPEGLYLKGLLCRVS